MVIIEKTIRVMKVISPKSLKYRRNNEKTTKSISVKSHGNTINLHSLIIKLLNAEKTILKKDYGFHEAFNIFDEVDNKRSKLNE